MPKPYVIPVTQLEEPSTQHSAPNSRMKSPLALLPVAALLLSSVTAWTVLTSTTATATRKEVLEGFATAAGIATAVAFSPLTANAADSPFTGQYSDPKHPNCKRIVKVLPDNTVAISGTDGTPGCPPDGSGTLWRLTGDVDGKNILVDFSPKVRHVKICWVCGTVVLRSTSSLTLLFFLCTTISPGRTGKPKGSLGRKWHQVA